MWQQPSSYNQHTNDADGGEIADTYTNACKIDRSSNTTHPLWNRRVVQWTEEHWNIHGQICARHQIGEA